MQPLDSTFFDRPTLDVARDLVGARLVHDHPEAGRLVGRVVETEAYTQDDPAFHGWHLVDQETGQLKREGRGIDLFEAPGTAYVYLCYGVYHLLNVVTEAEGVGGAVLIRAVEPLEGHAFMREQRSAARRERDLTNGPGKLVEALGIGPHHHGEALTGPPLYFTAGGLATGERIATSSRIGITRGVERPWRFFIDDHAFVSPGKPSAER